MLKVAAKQKRDSAANAANAASSTTSAPVPAPSNQPPAVARVQSGMNT